VPEDRQVTQIAEGLISWAVEQLLVRGRDGCRKFLDDMVKESFALANRHLAEQRTDTGYRAMTLLALLSGTSPDRLKAPLVAVLQDLPAHEKDALFADVERYLERPPPGREYPP